MGKCAPYRFGARQTITGRPARRAPDPPVFSGEEQDGALLVAGRPSSTQHIKLPSPATRRRPSGDGANLHWLRF